MSGELLEGEDETVQGWESSDEGYCFLWFVTAEAVEIVAWLLIEGRARSDNSLLGMYLVELVFETADEHC